MATSSQTLEEVLHMTKAFKAQLYDTLHDLVDDLNDIFRSIQDSLDSMQKRFLIEDIMNEYHQEVYSWYALEYDCDDWYMDSYHFQDDNHFHLLFDDSPSPHIEYIMERSPTSSMHTIFQYSSVLVCYSHDFADMEGSTYLDPHDQCRSVEYHFQLVLEFKYISCGFHMNTWAWDPNS